MKYYKNTRTFHVEGIQFDWNFIFNMSLKTEKQLKKMHLKTNALSKKDQPLLEVWRRLVKKKPLSAKSLTEVKHWRFTRCKRLEATALEQQ